jgi:hypothetical protein
MRELEAFLLSDQIDRYVDLTILPPLTRLGPSQCPIERTLEANWGGTSLAERNSSRLNAALELQLDNESA